MTSNLLALAMLFQEEEHGPASPFEVEFGLFFWTWIVFLALFFTLKRFAWPAIVRATEQRESRIAKQLEEAERLNGEAKAVLDEHRRLLDGAKGEAAALVNEAKIVAEKERETILEKARMEQEHLLDRAKREIEAERDRAVAQLRREAVDLSLAAASRLVDAKLDDESNRKLVVEYLDSLGEGR